MTDQADALTTGLSLFNQGPDDLLPVLLETMLLDRGHDMAGEVYFVTEGQGVAIWAARAPEGRLCVLYEFLTEHAGAIEGSAGGTCQVAEQDLIASGGLVIYTGAASSLMAIGLAVDGYDEVRTRRGARFPVENNGFVVPLLPEEDFTDGTIIQFESFALVGPAGTIPADWLARPEPNLLH